MIRMKTVTLEEVHQFDADIMELSNRFRTTVRRDGFEFLFSFPKMLRQLPGQIQDPFSAVTDTDGTLVEYLGEEYHSCAARFMLGKFHPASEADQNLPEFEVEYDFKAEVTHVLIHVCWPADHPPVDAGLESPLGRRLKATFYGRELPDHEPCGMDAWIVPMNEIEAHTLFYLESRYKQAEAMIIKEWREYDLEKPYWRKLIEEATTTLSCYRIEFQFGDDFLTATVSDAARRVIGDVLDQPIWYRKHDLDRLLREVVLERMGLPPFLRDLIFGGSDSDAVISGSL